MKEYEYCWRNKWLTADAKTMDDLIDGLEAAADLLRDMREAGVTLRDDGCAVDDHATLVTTDPEVARRFDFEDPEEGDEGFEGEEEGPDDAG